jgi:hypothetical protein
MTSTRTWDDDTYHKLQHGHNYVKGRTMLFVPLIHLLNYAESV